MSFRGRGRGGRGRGGGFGFEHPAKHAPHEDFPDITLPGRTCAKASSEEKALMQSTLKFEGFWRHSCYHLEEGAPKKKNEDRDIERFSDRKRKTQEKREALASYLKLTPSNFPAELLQGSRRGQLSNKKLRWDKSSDEQAFEVFEKEEQDHKSSFGICRMERRKKKRKVMTRMKRKRKKQKRRKIQMMIIIRILSLMMMMMTGTNRKKHMRTTTIRYGRMAGCMKKALTTYIMECSSFAMVFFVSTPKNRFRSTFDIRL